MPGPQPALSSYTVVAIQTAHGSAPDRAAIQRNLERVVGLIEGAVWGYAHWGYPVKLVARGAGAPRCPHPAGRAGAACARRHVSSTSATSLALWVEGASGVSRVRF